MTQKRRMRVGSGTGPATRAPVSSAVSTICRLDSSSTLWSKAFSVIRIRCLATIIYPLSLPGAAAAGPPVRPVPPKFPR